MKIRTYILLFLAGIILVLLFRGPLFPWSPWKSGWYSIRSQNATVFIQKGDPAYADFHRIDKILESAEEFHDLKYKSHVKIVVLRPGESMKRFLPWFKGKGYSVNLSALNLVYIGPNARMSKFGTEAYLKHELSHMLIGQNTENSNFRKEMQRQSWFVEGVATYFGGPEFYDRAETFNFGLRTGLDFASLNESNIWKVPDNEKRLRYAYYSHFIGFLVDEFGVVRLREYIAAYIRDPFEYKDLFTEIYSRDLHSLLKSYLEYLQEDPAGSGLKYKSGED